MSAERKPTMQLTGTNGNAFAVLGRMRKAGRAAGWSDEQLAAVMQEAMAADYDGLLRVALKHFDVR